jgi:ribosomal protein S18 acetylase RimI-like enzyme
MGINNGLEFVKLLSMSLYSDYLKETNLKQILELESGFATYHLLGEECYIEDIYVLPDLRKSNKATELALNIEHVARQQGCKYLTGSVNTNIKDPTSSMKVLLAYGFKFLRSEPKIIWFIKQL